jgi:hypothetical protein
LDVPARCLDHKLASLYTMNYSARGLS